MSFLFSSWRLHCRQVDVRRTGQLSQRTADCRANGTDDRPSAGTSHIDQRPITLTCKVIHSNTSKFVIQSLLVPRSTPIISSILYRALRYANNWIQWYTQERDLDYCLQRKEDFVAATYDASQVLEPARRNILSCLPRKKDSRIGERICYL